MDNILREWNNQINGGIQIAPNFILKTMLFADDQVIINKTEYKLKNQLIYILQQISKRCSVETFVRKTKTMAFEVHTMFEQMCQIILI